MQVTKTMTCYFHAPFEHQPHNILPNPTKSMNYIVTLLLAILLQSAVAKSFRGHEESEERELTTLYPQYIRTFSFCMVAAAPANPANVSGNAVSILSGQTLGWLNSTFTNDTLISTTNTVYTKGTSWLGTGRRLATCNYLCILQRAATCRLCGSSRTLQQDRLDPKRLLSYSFNTTNTTYVHEMKLLELIIKPLLEKTFTNITLLNLTYSVQYL